MYRLTKRSMCDLGIKNTIVTFSRTQTSGVHVSNSAVKSFNLSFFSFSFGSGFIMLNHYSALFCGAEGYCCETTRRFVS